MRGSVAWKPGSRLRLSIVVVEPMVSTGGTCYEVFRSMMPMVAFSAGIAWLPTSTTARKRRRSSNAVKPILPRRSILVARAASVATSLRERCFGQKRPFKSLDTTKPLNPDWKRSFNVFIRKTRLWFGSRSSEQPRARIAIWNIACCSPMERSSTCTSLLTPRKDRLHDENVALREEIDQAFMFEEIVGSSPGLKTVLSSIVNVAPTDSTVLITGETGTGKELIARAIHKRSQRAGQPFIGVNCASIPSSLIASELFGHEKGAFTGAM